MLTFLGEIIIHHIHKHKIKIKKYSIYSIQSMIKKKFFMKPHETRKKTIKKKKKMRV